MLNSKYIAMDKLHIEVRIIIYEYGSTYKIKFGKVKTVVCPLLYIQVF